MRRLGGDVEVDGDSLHISPATLKGGAIDPHGDHRVAMSLALIGLVTPGITVAHPEVVNKTWPAFWNVLSGLESRQNS
jgi:3-phosphoshikimate 1-carboxyvinyltransferase